MEQDAVNKRAEQQPEVDRTEPPHEDSDVSHEDVSSSSSNLQPQSSSKSARAGADRLFSEIADIKETLDYIGSVLEVQRLAFDRLSVASSSVQTPGPGTSPSIPSPGIESDLFGTIVDANAANLSAEDAESIAECVRIRLEGEFSSILFDIGRIADSLRDISGIESREDAQAEQQPQASEQEERSPEAQLQILEALERLENSVSSLGGQDAEDKAATTTEVVFDAGVLTENLATLEQRVVDAFKSSFHAIHEQMQSLAVSADAKARGSEISAFAFKEMEVALGSKIEALQNTIESTPENPITVPQEIQGDVFEEQFAKLWKALDKKLELGSRRLRLYDNIFYGLVLLLLLSNLGLMGWHFFLR